MATPITIPSQEWFDENSSGSARRSFASKLADVVSILDFTGADPTGATDSTTAVANAYAKVVANGGGTIHFPRGTYKFNLTITTIGVSITGESTFATTFTPADLTKPVIQVGDGTTSSVQQNRFAHFSMEGDNTTATSDGFVQNGARYVSVHDVVIAHFGGDNIKVTSGTQASTYSKYSHVQSANPKGAALKLIYGSNFTTAITFANCGFEQSNTGTNSWAAYIEGVVAWFANCWFDVPNNHGIYMRFDSGTSTFAPFIHGSGSCQVDSNASTDVIVDIDLVGTVLNHQTSTTYIDGFSLDGQVKWDVDATVVSQKGTYPNRMKGATEILGPLAFNAHADDSRDEQSSPTTRILQGAGAAGNEALQLLAAGLWIPGTAATGLAFVTNGGRLWKSANGMLRFIPSGTPSADTQGISVTPHRQAITYSASMTINVALGTWAYIAATNGTAFTINAPSSGGAPLANLTDQRITITVSNTSGGALGAATWNATFKMAAWAQPANGFSRTIDFQYDGTNWIEISRAPNDVPN